MHSFEKQIDIKSEEALINFLKDYEPINPGGPVAIVGGHFMLMYDKYEDCLKPVIHQELDNPKHKEFAKLMAGDFPVKSFEYSLELIKYFKTRGIEAKNVFIVNDHKFQSNDFQPEILPLVKGRTGELRKKFYRQSNPIPNIYFDLSKKNDLFLEKNILENYNIKRHEDEILPKRSFFFSERTLRSRFNKRVKNKLAKYDEFQQVKDFNDRPSELYYIDSGENICLTEHGVCGCNSEVLEFANNLIQNNYHDILFFIPDECSAAVNQGLNIASFINHKYYGKRNKIVVLSGLGGMSINQNKLRPKINIYKSNDYASKR